MKKLKQGNGSTERGGRRVAVSNCIQRGPQTKESPPDPVERITYAEPEGQQKQN